jgi:hypothetical protein
MTEREIYLYKILMGEICAKNHGNRDEHDVQRALGALYEEWRINNDR